jgi:integrase
MPKRAKELTAIEVKRLSTPGMHFVGGVPGLLLQIAHTKDNFTENLPKSWILRTLVGGKRQHIGLGPFPAVGLSEARELARRLKEETRQGGNPVQNKKIMRSKLQAEAARQKTFKDCAEMYLERHSAKFTNDKHRKQWSSTLNTYVYPLIGNTLVSDLNKSHILEVLLQPIRGADGRIEGRFWDARSETASRIQGRMKTIIDFAIVAEYRTTHNPATWSGYLDTQLPSAVTKKKHHPALPYAEMANFMVALGDIKSISARALEFLILTAVRSGSVRMARWKEINYKDKVWTIPAENTKTKREHRVPLAPQAIELLKSLPVAADSPYIFPSVHGKPLSDMSLSMLMRGMRERGELTHNAVPHGFRSTFRDWAAEQTEYPDEIRKAASGHTVGDAVHAAYQRTDLLEKRRRLMNDWAEFITPMQPKKGKRTGGKP